MAEISPRDRRCTRTEEAMAKHVEATKELITALLEKSDRKFEEGNNWPRSTITAQLA